MRYDHFDFEVDSNVAANSGKASDGIVSPKLSDGARARGRRRSCSSTSARGFHSNDARGTTITVDPTDGVTPADRVSPLVTARGGEIGARTAILPLTQLAASLWTLELDSELVFVGDGGITESNRASRRRGWSSPHSSSRRLADGRCGLRVVACPLHASSIRPAIAFRMRWIASSRSASTVDHPRGWFGGARLRYFGAAPLIEDNSVRSDDAVVNADVGYRFANGVSASITGLEPVRLA